MHVLKQIIAIIFSYKHLNISSIATSEEHIIGVYTKDLCCNYTDWMSAWTHHLSDQSADVKVPR